MTVGWRRAARSPAVVSLAGIHMLVLLAGFFSPYDPTEQNRALPLVPPTRVHFLDAQGGFRRPFIYGLRLERDGYRESLEQRYPVQFLVSGSRYRILGLISCRIHLFGVADPGRVFLLGSDAFGRDQLSRILYGGQVSLMAGLLAATVTLTLGLTAGSIAGFCAGWRDAVVMRLAEVFLALPWLYLLLGVRAFLPLSLDPVQTFLLMIGVIGVVGWARPARLIRGMVLSAREREYVGAARSFGASGIHLLLWHIWPEVRSALMVQASVLIPQYILAEVTLSFLGLGVGEPASSWGAMLAVLRDPGMMMGCWWLAAPAFVLLPVFLCYYRIAGSLGEPADPK